MKNISILISQTLDFIKTDIWRIRLQDQPRKKSIFIKLLRIVLLALRGFNEDKCQLRASALTFYSLLSIVPVVAMIFGIAKGFGFEKMLEKQLTEALEGYEDIMIQVLDFANSMLANTKGGLIAGIGVVLLFWAVMKVLGNIEQSFNDIWEIKRARSYVRKFSDYLSIMLIAPILIILSSSVTVFITTQITSITQSIDLLGFFSPLIFFLVKLIPYTLIWLLFTFIYIVMPNTKVNFVSALLAGIIAGTLFQLTEWIYINFQVGVARYNAIYGSFAALPMFLIWMQLSWLIVLFGAELSFAYQNVDRYEFEIDSSRISSSYKRLLSLLTGHLIVKTFSRGENPLTAREISDILEIPVRIVRQIIYELVECKIISEINTESPREVTYQPARSINTLTVKFIFDALDQRGIEDIPVAQTKDLEALSGIMDSFRDAIEKSPGNKLLKDI
ncbi:MAG: YihY/virulence factor BrkB family protein [Bacteroidota bacterium]